MQQRNVIVLTVLCAFVLVQAVWTQNSDDTQAVKQVLEMFENAYIQENADMLRDVLSDTGYVMVIRDQSNPENAVILDKQQIIGAIQSQWKRVDYVEHHHTDCSIELHGPAATANSIIRDRFANGDTRTSPVYHIFAREKGIWKIVFTSALLAE
jgi:hypothetical protein